MFESQLPASQALSDHIAGLLSRLIPARKALETLRSDCEFDLFCGQGVDSGQSVIILSASILRQLGELGLDFELHLYRA